MSPRERVNWATTPAPGLNFDDIIVFQHITENINNNKE
jgi:hypothetical protein